MENATNIMMALEALQSRPAHQRAYIIIEEVESTKFVQFTRTSDRKLLLDLPAPTLSEVEFYRAVAFFKPWGISATEYQLPDGPGVRQAVDQYTFELPIPSPEKGAELALSVFAQIYQMPADLTVSIRCSWLM